VYKKLGDQSKAMVHLTRALDLSPKDAQQIKAAILNLEKEDNAEEEECVFPLTPFVPTLNITVPSSTQNRGCSSSLACGRAREL
jgi:hypothetical protein